MEGMAGASSAGAPEAPEAGAVVGAGTGADSGWAAASGRPLREEALPFARRVESMGTGCLERAELG